VLRQKGLQFRRYKVWSLQIVPADGKKAETEVNSSKKAAVITKSKEETR
jgi:hypothetical protein